MRNLFLLLLLLLEILRKSISITITSQIITITSHTIKFIITVESKKHSTSRLQSNIQRPLLLPMYHTLPQTHYHR